MFNCKGQNTIEYILVLVILIVIVLYAIGEKGFVTKAVNASLESTVSGIEKSVGTSSRFLQDPTRTGGTQTDPIVNQSNDDLNDKGGDDSSTNPCDPTVEDCSNENNDQSNDPRFPNRPRLEKFCEEHPERCHPKDQ